MEFVVYSLDGPSLGIKEKIQDRIGDKLEQNEQGIDDLIKFLDRIYLEHEMSEASDVLVAQGWRRSEKLSGQSKGNPEEAEKNSVNYKDRKKYLRKDNKVPEDT